MHRAIYTALALLLAAAPARAQPSATLFFFSPDFSPGNLSILKQAAEAYLRETGTPVRFQAFVRFEDFRRELESQHPEFVVVPQWAATAECLGAVPRPIATPVRGGETFGRKALIAPPRIERVADVAGGSIAATLPPGGTASGSELDRLRREHPTVRIIAVPKDIDALLAAAFGQVDAAYVSTRQFGMFAAANPKLGSELREIGYAESIPFPMIYATASAQEHQVERLRDAAINVSASGTGKRLVGLLGYDGWVAVDDSTTTPSSPKAGGPCGRTGESLP